MIFTIESNHSVDETWKYFTDPIYLNKWLSESSDVYLRKNGKFNLVIDKNMGHTTQGCKIIEIIERKQLVIFWKGPPQFDITMNEFQDMWTQIEILLDDNPSRVTIEHIGWKSSEDWQEAKEWHEQEFWPPKISKLKQLLDNG